MKGKKSFKTHQVIFKTRLGRLFNACEPFRIIQSSFIQDDYPTKATSSFVVRYIRFNCKSTEYCEMNLFKVVGQIMMSILHAMQTKLPSM